MTDLWADVRDKATTDEHDGWCISWANEHLPCDCHLSLLRALLADADALLAVVRATENADAILLPYWMGPEFGEKPTDKQVYEAIAELNQSLAALPEHLKGDNNERPRKA